jgi:peroxiredoxin/uncharacterized membrane protein YphA (DoxX/SURF4 family)
MSAALLLARLLLGAIFGIAGIAKLADRRGTHEAVQGFGVPAGLALPLALGLPVAELTIAIALLPRATAAEGALAAAGLLLLFTTGIAVNLARGRSPDCHCFGQLHSAPAGWRTLARNGGLAGLAAFVAWQGWRDAGTSATVLVEWARPAELVALSVLLAGGWFGYQLLRQQGRLLVRIEALEAALAANRQQPTALAPERPAVVQHQSNGSGPRPQVGLPIGSPIDVSLPDLDGNRVSLAAYRGKRVLLVHWSPQCGFCDLIAPELAGLERELRKRKTEFVFASFGEPDANRTLASEHGLRGAVLLQDGSRISAFEGQGTPAAYLVDEEGRVARPLAVGANEVPELAREVAKSRKRGRSKLDVEPLRAGAAAPTFALPDLSGEEVSLASYRGRRVLLVFSDPQCAACDELLAELASRNGGAGDDAPELVIVGRGDEKANREKAAKHGVQVPYLLQRQWTVAEAYGTFATPAAFLVDEDGLIAHDAAMGPEAILKLARGATASSNGTPGPELKVEVHG